MRIKVWHTFYRSINIDLFLTKKTKNMKKMLLLFLAVLLSASLMAQKQTKVKREKTKPAIEQIETQKSVEVNDSTFISQRSYMRFNHKAFYMNHHKNMKYNRQPMSMRKYNRLNDTVVIIPDTSMVKQYKSQLRLRDQSCITENNKQ